MSWADDLPASIEAVDERSWRCRTCGGTMTAEDAGTLPGLLLVDAARTHAAACAPPTPGTWDELTDAELRARAHGVELRRRGLAVQIADRLAELRDLDLRANDADDEAEALAAELARRGVPGLR